MIQRTISVVSLVSLVTGCSCPTYRRDRVFLRKLNYSKRLIMTMIFERMDCTLVVLVVFLKIKFLSAQEVNNTSSIQGGALSSVDSRFSDVGGRGMGYPNLREPRRFGNSQSNYPGNSFLPYDNQRPEQDSGWRPDSQNPKQRRPYQQPTKYPGNQEYPNNYPYPKNPNNFRPTPNNFNGGVNNDFNNRNPYPNYNPRPRYPNRPTDGMMYPGNMDRPYQNEDMPQSEYPDRPMDVPGSVQEMNYPPQNGQYPREGNFQGTANVRPGDIDQNSRPEYPDDIANMPNSNIKFPENEMPHQNQLNQYPFQNGLGSQGSLKIRPNQKNDFPSNPSNIPANMPYPINKPRNNNGGIQYPNEGSINQRGVANGPEPNLVFRDNFNGVPQTNPQLTNNQLIDSINGQNTNDTVAILGKPVFVPSTTTSPGQN